MSSGLVRQGKFEEAVQRAENALKPEIVRIRYSLGNDWTDDPSIFFRILLSDDASRPNRLQEVAERVTQHIIQEVRSEEYGYHAYFNFRSNSEQEKLRDPAWA
jgi:hypothetical protein